MEKVYKNETEYEKAQKFNALVSWLHSYRYKHIIDIFKQLSLSADKNPIKVVEIGCAHAKLFSILNDKFNIDYTGIEIEDSFINVAKERYQHNPNFHIIQGHAEKELDNTSEADIVIAFETMEHIPEHIAVRVIEKIAKLRPKLFVCSVPVEIGPAIWFKNVGSFLTGYKRHREYTWKETFWAGLAKLDKLPPHGIAHKGFDWRWLAQTIRHNMKIKEIRTFPLPFMPASLSTSVFFIVQPR